MDQIDRRILAELTSDGRQTITELAGRINLSLSRCQRRLRDLEHRGVIRGYHAEIDLAQLGYSFEAVVFVTMAREDHGTISTFESMLERVPGLVDAQRMAGDPDYLLRVYAEDQRRYQQLYDSELSTLPGVERLTTTIIMKQVVKAAAPPLV